MTIGCLARLFLSQKPCRASREYPPPPPPLGQGARGRARAAAGDDDELSPTHLTPTPPPSPSCPALAPPLPPRPTSLFRIPHPRRAAPPRRAHHAHTRAQRTHNTPALAPSMGPWLVYGAIRCCADAVPRHTAAVRAAGNSKKSQNQRPESAGPNAAQIRGYGKQESARLAAASKQGLGTARRGGRMQAKGKGHIRGFIRGGPGGPTGPDRQQQRSSARARHGAQEEEAAARLGAGGRGGLRAPARRATSARR